MFEVGQRVVCIWDEWDSLDYCEQGKFWLQCTPNRPIKQNIYTVRKVFEDVLNKCMGIHVHELLNPLAVYGEFEGEPGFKTKYFRPVRDTNIDVFVSLLAPGPVSPVKEDA